MNWNNVGTYVKNGANNLLNKLFGITTKNQKPKLKHLKAQEEHAYFNRQLSDALVEIEIQKSQALKYLRGFQNR